MIHHGLACVIKDLCPVTFDTRHLRDAQTYGEPSSLIRAGPINKLTIIRLCIFQECGRIGPQTAYLCNQPIRIRCTGTQKPDWTYFCVVAVVCRIKYWERVIYAAGLFLETVIFLKKTKGGGIEILGSLAFAAPTQHSTKSWLVRVGV